LARKPTSAAVAHVPTTIALWLGAKGRRTGPSLLYKTKIDKGKIAVLNRETKQRYVLDGLVGRFLQRRELLTETAADHKDDDDGGADLSSLDATFGSRSLLRRVSGAWFCRLSSEAIRATLEGSPVRRIAVISG